MSLFSKLISLKEETKRSKIVRLLTKPYMERHLHKVDKAYQETEDSRWLASQKDIHKGRRCFIVGNGPSLTMDDLDLIKNEYSFGANSIFTCFDKTEWRPTYYLSVDRTSIALDGERMTALDLPCVMVDRTISRYISNKPNNMHFLNLHMRGFATDKYTTSNIDYSDHPEICLYGGYTVTYAAMQLALFMGFKEIILLGIDHSYAWEVTSDNKIIVRGEHDDHFFEDKGPKGHLYYEGVEFAYALAKEKAASKSAVILNATRGGNLKVFDRVSLEKILCSS